MSTNKMPYLEEFKRIAEEFSFALKSETTTDPLYHLTYHRGGDPGITIEYLCRTDNLFDWHLRGRENGNSQEFPDSHSLQKWLTQRIAEPLRKPPRR